MKGRNGVNQFREGSRGPRVAALRSLNREAMEHRRPCAQKCTMPATIGILSVLENCVMRRDGPKAQYEKREIFVVGVFLSAHPSSLPCRRRRRRRAIFSLQHRVVPRLAAARY